LQSLWELRERLAESLCRDGCLYTLDISLPLEHFYDGVKLCEDFLKGHPEVVRITGFGHLGDGNLHVNVTSRQFNPDFLQYIELQIFQWVSSVRGSISAEHGIGLFKPSFVKFSRTPNEIALMKNIKKLMDPNGILNPLKVVPLG